MPICLSIDRGKITVETRIVADLNVLDDFIPGVVDQFAVDHGHRPIRRRREGPPPDASTA